MKKPDPLKALRSKIGAYAVRRLREGKAVLCCWRGSSPHNWFVHTVKRESRLWHSAGWGDRPSLEFFDLLSNSNERIPHSSVHREGGSPFASTYVLKAKFRKS